MALPQISGVFDEIAILLLISAIVGVISLRLKQPPIIGYIAVGILVGPSGFGLVKGSDQVHLLAELGLALLLFVVGLRLDISLIRSTGPVAIAIGLGQVVFTAIIGYFICIGLAMNHITALYVSVALTFSSTIIIVKLLSDKKETDSLHGRIAVGLLIVQDMLVVLTMIALSGLGHNGDVSMWVQIVRIMAKGIALLAGLGLMMYFILPWLTTWLARSAELLILFAIAWAVILADICYHMGFSKEVGAFLAGVSLASTPYRELIGARLVSLRDFLLLFFFVELGTQLNLRLLGSQVWSAIPLSIFVLVGNPIVVMIIMAVMGYRKRTGFLTGLLVAQVSEFSLILAALGLNLGHIDSQAVGLITLVALATIGLSTYLILYSNNIYEWLSPYLGIFERKISHKEQSQDAERDSADILIFGLGRYGSAIARDLMKTGRSVVGIDFDPRAVKKWNDQGGRALFGDAEDPEFPSMLPLSGARWVISSVRDKRVTHALLQSLKSHGYIGGIAVTSGERTLVREYKTAGANIVFVPYMDSALHAVDVINAADKEEDRRKMDNYIAALHDHYIVCGYGRMGRQIVRDFKRAAVPFVVVEWNPEQIPRLIEDEVPFVEGKATEDDMLIKAGIERAKGLIAVTATDEENVFIVLSARGLNPGLHIVARSTKSENEGKLRRAGADRVMSPYIFGGRQIASAVLKPQVMDFLGMVLHSDELDLELGEAQVMETSKIAGKTIRESGIVESSGVLILAVRSANGELHTTPSPDFEIKAWDHMILIGSSAQIQAAQRFAHGE